MKISINKILLSVILAIGFVSEAMSQVLPDEGPCGGPFDACVPIDGGASILLGLGIIYGGKKILELKKKVD